jgi:hypothetical protein
MASPVQVATLPCDGVAVCALLNTAGTTGRANGCALVYRLYLRAVAKWRHETIVGRAGGCRELSRRGQTAHTRAFRRPASASLSDEMTWSHVESPSSIVQVPHLGLPTTRARRHDRARADASVLAMWHLRTRDARLDDWTTVRAGREVGDIQKRAIPPAVSHQDRSSRTLTQGYVTAFGSKLISTLHL